MFSVDKTSDLNQLLFLKKYLFYISIISFKPLKFFASHWNVLYETKMYKICHLFRRKHYDVFFSFHSEFFIGITILSSTFLNYLYKTLKLYIFELRIYLQIIVIIILTSIMYMIWYIFWMNYCDDQVFLVL